MRFAIFDLIAILNPQLAHRNSHIATRTSQLAHRNPHIAHRNSQLATPYCLISAFTICLMGGIRNAVNPIRAIPDPEMMNAFPIPIESAMNPVANRPIIDGSRVMLE